MAIILLIVALSFIINPAWSWDLTVKFYNLVKNNWTKFIKGE